MSRPFPARVASVRFAPDGVAGASRLAASLLAASPRVSSAGEGLCRADARGWKRRGGEAALARALREAASGSGLVVTGVGIADVPVAADAASLLAADREERTAIVPVGESRRFLSPLPLALLPLPEDLRETLRALGLRRVGDLASRPREEMEARFGPEGVRAHRLACGEDDRPLRALRPDESPEAELELDPPADSLEPLLFVLRHLLARVCSDLADAGRGAARLALVMTLDGGGRRTASIVPARPTRRDALLHDLCRAALERAGDGTGRLPAPVAALAIRVTRAASLDTRQGDLFRAEWRDPMAAAGALSRLRARLGAEGVVWPAPRADPRPESRNAWRPVEMGSATPREDDPGTLRGDVGPGTARAGPGRGPEREGPQESAVRGTLRLLPEPEPLQVRTEAGRPVALWDESGRRDLVAAEGPERLSGDWWRDPYRREYFHLCTDGGELLWAFREVRRDGSLRWWLHGWWD